MSESVWNCVSVFVSYLSEIFLSCILDPTLVERADFGSDCISSWSLLTVLFCTSEVRICSELCLLLCILSV